MPIESSYFRILFEALSKVTKIPSGPRIWMRFFARKTGHTRVALRTHRPQEATNVGFSCHRPQQTKNV